jgi:hypothetical protein
MVKIKINLLDALTNKLVLKDVTMEEAAEHLGISYKTLTNTKYSGGLIQGRYRAVKIGIVPSRTYLKAMERLDMQEKLSYEDDFKKRWDEAMKPFRILSKRKKAAV